MRDWWNRRTTPKPGDRATMAQVAAASAGSLPPGAHRHGDEVHLEAHAHPHVQADLEGRPVLGIVGGGPVGMTLAAAFHRAGWPLGAVASRDPGRRERLRALAPGARAFAEPAAILDECHLAILAVPDDALADVAAGMRLYSGQAIVHTSGLHGAEILAPAMAAGTSAGSFHPLVAFADVDRALTALANGATVAIEGDEDIQDLLAEMARAIGGTAVRLAPGSKPAYHAAAVLAAGGLVALLDAVAEVARATGLDEAGALAIYGPLAGQALGNARALGIAAALTGPALRGDAGTIAAHLTAIATQAPSVLDIYRALVSRQVAIAVAARGLEPVAADRLRARLAETG